MSSLEFLAVIVGACVSVFLAGFSLAFGVWAGVQAGRSVFGALNIVIHRFVREIED